MVAQLVTQDEPTRERRLLIGGNPNAPAPIPLDEEFEENETDFLDAPLLAKIGAAVIAAYPEEFGHLNTATIRYLWKRKGGKHQGSPILGYCWKASGIGKFYAGGEFVIWIGADTAREIGLTNYQLEAAIFHETLHAEVDPETAKPAIRGHDCQMFNAEVERYGLWIHSLQGASEAFEQVAMFDPTPLRRLP